MNSIHLHVFEKAHLACIMLFSYAGVTFQMWAAIEGNQSTGHQVT